VAAGARIRDVFVSDVDRLTAVVALLESDAHIYEVSDQILRAITDAVTPQGVVAVADLPERSLTDLDLTTGLVLVVDQVRDPGNAGTLIRSAAAAGCGGVVFTEGSVDPYAPKTLRAAAGAVFRNVLVSKVALPAALEHLRGEGFALLGGDARSEVSLYDVDLSGPTAIVLGNEAWGLTDPSGLDVTAGIPMPGGVESLNAAVAGSVFLFEAVRQRRIASSDDE